MCVHSPLAVRSVCLARPQIVLTGENLAGGSNYTCRFGNRVVLGTLQPDGSVQCASPANCAGRLRAQISLNAQQYDPGCEFVYFGGAACTGDGQLAGDSNAGDEGSGTQVHSLCPSSGPYFGETRVVVIGQAFNFGTEYVCEVDHSTDYVRCAVHARAYVHTLLSV